MYFQYFKNKKQPLYINHTTAVLSKRKRNDYIE